MNFPHRQPDRPPRNEPIEARPSEERHGVLSGRRDHRQDWSVARLHLQNLRVGRAYRFRVPACRTKPRICGPVGGSPSTLIPLGCRAMSPTVQPVAGHSGRGTPRRRALEPRRHGQRAAAECSARARRSVFGPNRHARADAAHMH
jgi:hypothetical protein